MIKCFNITPKVISHNEAMKSDLHFTATDSEAGNVTRKLMFNLDN